MADLATYQNQASSIYDPQLQADEAQALQKENTTLAGLDQETKTIEPAYQTAIRNLNDSVRGQTGQINQLYSERLGGQFSGLQGNDMGMMYSKANQQQSDIETQRANKLSDIASRRTLAQTGYQTDVGSLTSKYQGMKNQYAQSAYDSALKEEEQQRQFNANYSLEQQKLAASRASAAAQTPSTQQFLTQAFSGYKPAYQGGQSYYTEHEVIPALMANYGMSEKDAANLAYSYRQQVFGEGYGSVGR